MDSDEVIKTIDQIEATAKEMIASHDPARRQDQCIFLSTQLDELMRKMVKQIDFAEKDFLTEIIELIIMVNRRYNFDEILGTGIKYTLLTSYINALIYQKDWKFEKLSECLSIIEKTYMTYLGLDNKKTMLTTPSKAFPKTEQIFGSDVMKRIRLAICFCDALLQHTAVYSQLGQHEDALNSCLKCFEILMVVIGRFGDIFAALKLIGVENLKGLGLFTNDIGDYDTYIDFLKTVKMPKMGQNEPWSNSVPNWKINKENNLKYIFQKIDAQRQMAGMKILTRKIDKDWVETFHISNIVKLQPFEEFCRRLEVDDFDEDLILRTILTMACCIFSVAAENRFISFKEIQNKPQPQNSDAAPSKSDTDKKKPKMMDDMSKDLRLQKEPRFILSEKIHMKTLEILTFGLKDTIRLLSHCFQSYKKNYDLNILMIEEVDEPSFSTIRNSEYFCNGIDESQNLEEIDKLNRRIQKLVNSEKYKEGNVYDDDEPANSKPKASTDKIKAAPSSKANVYASLYGPGKTGMFSKSKTNLMSLGLGASKDPEIQKFNLEVIDNGDALNEKRVSRTPTRISKPQVLVIDGKTSDPTKSKDTTDFESNSKERTLQRNLGKFEPGKSLQFNKIRETLKFDVNTSNGKANKKSLSTTYKTTEPKNFLKTMDNNSVKNNEKFEPEKSEDRFQKFRREVPLNVGPLTQEIGTALRINKTNSLSRDNTITKKTGTSVNSSGMKSSREIVKEGKHMGVLEPSPKNAASSKFSLLINQMNQANRTSNKFEKGDVLGLIKSGKAAPSSGTPLNDLLKYKSGK